MSHSQSAMNTLRSYWARVIVIGGIFALSVAAVVLLYLVYTDAISGGEATAIATVLLVALTGIYATVTYLMMLETRKARQQEIKPAFEFRAQEHQSSLVNVGNGPARKFKVTIRFLPVGEFFQVQRPSVQSNGEVVIQDPQFPDLGEWDYLELQLQSPDVDVYEIDDEGFPQATEKHPYQQLTIDGSCEDIWGNKIPIEEEYEVLDLTVGR